MKEAENNGLTIRAIGGLAVFLHCPGSKEYFDRFNRTIHDIDLLGLSTQSEKACRVLCSIGFQEDTRFRMISGGRRRSFVIQDNSVNVDLIFDKLSFCQNLDLRNRITIDYPTISVSDLFLSKIQIHEMKLKDVVDICALLNEHKIIDDTNEGIDIGYITRLCSINWRWWKALKEGFRSIRIIYSREIGNEFAFGSILEEMEYTIDSSEKTLSWKLRNLLGEHISWYDHVESL
ncbi:MAG: hypothetical protein V3V99_11140 [candidate division Zixibacteria bacterium]